MRPEKIKVKLTIDNKDDFVITNIEEPIFLRKPDIPFSEKYIYGIRLSCISVDDLCWIRDKIPNIRGKKFKISVSADGKELSSVSGEIFDMYARWKFGSPDDVFVFDVTIEYISKEPPLIADDLCSDSVPDSAWTDKIPDGVVHGSFGNFKRL